LTLNDPIRAIFLYSRNGTHSSEPRSEYLSWYNVDWSAMDQVTYSRSQECVIDDYTLIEDSYNAPILVEQGKECANFFTTTEGHRDGKHIYPSVELCADAVKVNGPNCNGG
jgi:hypothetical protein